MARRVGWVPFKGDGRWWFYFPSLNAPKTRPETESVWLGGWFLGSKFKYLVKRYGVMLVFVDRVAWTEGCLARRVPNGVMMKVTKVSPKRRRTALDGGGGGGGDWGRFWGGKPSGNVEDGRFVCQLL